MENEIYDGKIILKVKGQEMRKFENRTTREIIMILEDVQEKIRHGKMIEHFEISREIKLI